MSDHLGVPDGVLALAASMMDGAAPLLHSADDDDWLDRQLIAPLSLDDEPWPRSQPTAVVDGWVQAEIIDADAALFETVLSQHRDHAAEDIAAACQELRLPVCPFRELPTRQPPAGKPPRTACLNTAAPPTGSLVLDMTTHWAGPLATGLLAEAGATVIKIDPDCRPDGFRKRPGLYEHLNGAKEIVDIDLRVQVQRDHFESLVAKADLIVESFSRRVMPNLGYCNDQLRRLNPSLRVLSIKAFPRGSRHADWLAFGPGVHAMSGLALACQDSTDRSLTGPSMPAVAYPDFLTGLAGFIEGLRLLDSTGAISREVSLAGTIQPLVNQAIAAQSNA